MEELDDNPSGFSDLFPFVPLLCVASIICCTLILPSFVKTRVFILNFYVLWLIFGCALIAVNMCIWRNNIRDIPIYCDFVARVLDIYPITLYLSISCFNKFVWNMTKPEPSRKIYDTHTHNNRLDAFICMGFSLLWLPICIIGSPGRYAINEDIGPWPVGRMTVVSFLVHIIPLGSATMASVVFSILTALNISRSRTGKRYGPLIRSSPKYRDLERSRLLKYLMVSVIGVVENILGFIWSLQLWFHHFEEEIPWYATFTSSMQQMPLVYKARRHDLTRQSALVMKGFLIALPLVGIQLFLLFGLGSEARQMYRSRLWTLAEFLKAPVIYKWLKKQGKIFMRPRVTNSPEIFTPFEPNDIALEPCTAILSRNDYRAPSRKAILVSEPPLILTSSKRSQLRNTQPLPINSSERWRTFHKNQIPSYPVATGTYRKPPPPFPAYHQP
ncbi:a-factor receptor [Serendipita sp. 411]|nr:a-factor receptor [Serendipita sp. 411]